MSAVTVVLGAKVPLLPVQVIVPARHRSLHSNDGPVVLEIFQGKHYGSIFGTIMLAALAGGAAGPWATGLLHDVAGDYTIAFAVGIAVSLLSAIAIFRASPGKVRAVAGKVARG